MSELVYHSIIQTPIPLNLSEGDCSLLNAIRRIIIGEVPVKFRTEGGRESDIKILKNICAP